MSQDKTLTIDWKIETWWKSAKDKYVQDYTMTLYYEKYIVSNSDIFYAIENADIEFINYG